MTRLFLLTLTALFLTACAGRTSGVSRGAAEVLEAWSTASNPGAGHKLLVPLVGSWSTEVQFWTEPGVPVEVSQGSAESKWILGGRFVEEHYLGIAYGNRVEGRGLFGYDTTTQKFISLWIDNTSTAFHLAHGDVDALGKTLTYVGQFFDPEAKKFRRTRSVITILDPDRHRFEMYDELKTGGEFKTLEILYTRKGQGDSV